MIHTFRTCGEHGVDGVHKTSSYTGIRGVWVYLAVVMTIALALASSTWVVAESATPAAEQPTEQTTPTQPPVSTTPATAEEEENPEPAQPPAVPVPSAPDVPVVETPDEPEPEAPVVTEPPVDPAPAVPTETEPPVEPEPEQPAPDAPVIPEPVETQPVETEEPATEVAENAETPEATIPPTPEPTATPSPTPEPSPTPSPTPEPSPTPSPTPEPTPVITWSQTEPVTCTAGDQSSGLTYQGSRTYHCNVVANVSSDREMPNDMEIEWTLDVDFPDSYTLQFPNGSQASVARQLSTGATSTTYTISHPWQQGGAQKLAFDLVVTRTTCTVGEHVLSIQANPQIDTRESDAEIKRAGGSSSPSTYTADFLPNLDPPDASMDGVYFGSIQWDGSSYGTALSTGTVTVTNSNPCATSRPHSIQLHISSSDEHVRPVLTAVDPGTSGFTLNGEGDGIVTIPSGFEGSASFNVEFVLEPANDAPVGTYGFGFELTVNAIP